MRKSMRPSRRLNACFLRKMGWEAPLNEHGSEKKNSGISHVTHLLYRGTSVEQGPPARHNPPNQRETGNSVVITLGRENIEP